jgi:hypothetical protein
VARRRHEAVVRSSKKGARPSRRRLGNAVRLGRLSGRYTLLDMTDLKTVVLDLSGSLQ